MQAKLKTGPLPPTLFFITLLLMAALHMLLPIKEWIGFPWRLIGFGPLAIGVLLNILADSLFKQHATTVKPFQASTALLTAGVFRISRNPMYLGMICVLAGIALLLGSLSPWLAVFGFAILMDRLFIRNEERMLETTFGEAFRRYKTCVRKWL